MQTKTVNGRRLIAVSVLAVTDYRATLGGKVHTNLVRSSGLQMEFHEGINNPSRPPLKGGDETPILPPLWGGLRWGL